MANWKNKIVVEVKLPYITQGCTLDYLTAKLEITSEDIWFTGHDRESRMWKAYIPWGDYPIIVKGKTTNTPKHGDQPTTYKVKAWNNCNGLDHGNEQYKTKVISYE